MEERFIKIKLEDAIVKATDEQGEERLRLTVTVDGHEVLCRFPRYKDWDFYAHDLSKLMILIAQGAQDIELDIDLIPEKFLPQWAYVMGEVLKYKECRELVEKIFFDYLRPTIEGMDEARPWLEEHMGIDHVYNMFIAILHIEDWLKKKARAVLTTKLPSQTQPSSKDSSANDSTFQPASSPPGQPFEFGLP